MNVPAQNLADHNGHAAMRWLAALKWLAVYQRGWIRADVVAGIVGLIALALLIAGKIFLKHRPVALLVVIGGIVAALVFSLESRGVHLIGTVPRGLPHIRPPAVGAEGIRLQAVEAHAAVRDCLRAAHADVKLGGIDRFRSVTDILDDLAASDLTPSDVAAPPAQSTIVPT